MYFVVKVTKEVGGGGTDGGADGGYVRGDGGADGGWRRKFSDLSYDKPLLLESIKRPETHMQCVPTVIAI